MDPRICVEFDPFSTSTNVKYQDMPAPYGLYAREVLMRIAHAIRFGALTRETVHKLGVIDELTIDGFAEQHKVCIAVNPEDDHIQVAISGLNFVEACIACDKAAAILLDANLRQGEMT